jgi:hypothetical protein
MGKRYSNKGCLFLLIAIPYLFIKSFIDHAMGKYKK